MVTKDRQRYEKEMKQLNEKGYFINSDGVKSTDLDKKGNVKEFPEGTVMPKKVKTAYMFYFIEQQLQNKKDVGEDQKANVTETTKKIVEAWRTMTNAEKKKYTDLVDKDRERYDK